MMNKETIDIAIEMLVWCTKDPFSLQYFYTPKKSDSYEYRQESLNTYAHIIYYAVKSGLLQPVEGFEGYYDKNGVLIAPIFANIEEFVAEIRKFPVEKIIGDDVMDDMTDKGNMVWFGEQFEATDLLDKIVNNCGIEAYIDEFNMNDARWQQFYCEISSYLHLEDTSENRI